MSTVEYSLVKYSPLPCVTDGLHSGSECQVDSNCLVRLSTSSILPIKHHLSFEKKSSDLSFYPDRHNLPSDFSFPGKSFGELGAVGRERDMRSREERRNVASQQRGVVL